MKALFLTVLLAVSAMAQAVRVTGPAYDPSGAAFTNGTISVSGGVVRETIDLTDGTFGITLPAIPATASNTFYRAVYRTRTGTTWTRFWIPRASSTAVEVSAIESTAPPAGEVSPTQIGGALGNNTRVLCSNGSVTVWCDASSGGGTSLPSQSGNNGRFLTTNGSTPSWAVINSAVWGNITGELADQLDVTNALNSKEPTIAAGTTGQYWRGDKTWTAFPTIPTIASTNNVLKGSGGGNAIGATAGVDYAPATNGTNGQALTSDGAGGFGTAVNLLRNSPVTFEAGVCQGASPAMAFSFKTGTGATALCADEGGANGAVTGVAAFDAVGEQVQGRFTLPNDFNASGTVRLDIYYRAVPIAGTVTWRLDNATVADGETSGLVDFSAANQNTASASTVQGTTLRRSTVTVNSLTTTGWAANEQVYWRLVLSASTATVSTSSTIQVVAVRFTIPRA
jgi:hypothetical protein